MNSELHFDTRFEIYGSTIGVRNLVCYVRLGQQFNGAIQEQIPTPNLPIKLQLGPIGITGGLQYYYLTWSISS